MRKTLIYTVRTIAGITYHLEAANDSEARERAALPDIGNHLAEMMRQAVSNIDSVEPYRGPAHLARYPIFRDDVFKI